MAQIKFSQKSIAGLEDALLALSVAATMQGSNGSLALEAAVNAEVEARNAAISTETTARVAAVAATDAVVATINGDSTVVGSFRKAIADVIGSAPEALNTLKEIADYIAVNPSATVADAITAAITAANTAVTDVSTALEDYKVINDGYVSAASEIVFGSCDVTFDEIDANGFATFRLQNGTGSVGGWGEDGFVVSVLNFETVRHTVQTTGVSYDVPVSVNSTFVHNAMGGYTSQVFTADFRDIAEEILTTSSEGVGLFAGQSAKIQYIRGWDNMDLLSKFW